MNNNSKAHSFNRLKNLVDEHILDFIPKIDPKSKTLYESMKYSLTAGGKRIRPVLILASCELCGKKCDTYLPYAIAAEYIHTYSLIHDDLPAMDNDDYRRGKLTNHKVFGEDMAILAGDGLLSAAYEVMTKDMLLYLDDYEELKNRVKATYALSKGTGCRGMLAGQVVDVESEGKVLVPEMLDFIHLNKTAAFISSAVLCGAYLGHADNQHIEDLKIYGESLGLAFQIADDILDVTSTLEELGKSIGSDEKDHKFTYVSLYGIDGAKVKCNELLSVARNSISKYYDHAEVLDYILDIVYNSINHE